MCPLSSPAPQMSPDGCPRTRQPVRPLMRPVRPLPWRRCGVSPLLRGVGGGSRPPASPMPLEWPLSRGAGRASGRPLRPVGLHDAPDWKVVPAAVPRSAVYSESGRAGWSRAVRPPQQDPPTEGVVVAAEVAEFDSRSFPYMRGPPEGRHGGCGSARLKTASPSVGAHTTRGLKNT